MLSLHLALNWFFLSVKKSVIREEMLAYARECWGLLPAFCRCPSDVRKTFQALTTLLIPFLKDSFMLENISAALQVSPEP